MQIDTDIQVLHPLKYQKCTSLAICHHLRYGMIQAKDSPASCYLTTGRLMEFLDTLGENAYSFRIRPSFSTHKIHRLISETDIDNRPYWDR